MIKKSDGTNTSIGNNANKGKKKPIIEMVLRFL